MDYIQYEAKGLVAEIVFQRPDAYNAFNEQMLNELKEACIKAAESEALIVLLRGSGRGFSAGGDIHMMTSPHDSGQFKQLMDTIETITITLFQMKKITVAAIHGAAAGLGLSVALCADMVLAEKNAGLAMNFNGIGLIPDGGGHYLLMKRVGETEAKKLIWSGKKLSAEEAVILGLADGTFSGEPAAGAEPYVNQLLASPLQAMIETKAIYQSLHEDKLKQVLSLERSAQERMRKTKDHQEGIRAFLEKRKPMFNT
ncbi:enoyl-CoA hydratase [Bacillus atrophaeus]|uniref:enoyl-CoA hydratase n=1 Tax=Bacillus atrophaeus TaxID=1452 RepID=UPI000B92D268|nr:enoyl-CoA hydratase [Bacillus atrophaeus]ASS70499.1 enoyl-CoA hydratase [Bacillus atrophaeus]PSA96722.1 enoyl-CoA hydratase [Bacillus atrophaeus]